MIRNIPIFFFALLQYQLWAQAPQLITSATGHTGKVRSLNFISENELISISDDKSIRWWDIITGEELGRKYLNSSTGYYGMLYASDYQPDKKLIAVSGYPGFPEQKSKITLIDAKERTLVSEVELEMSPVNVVIFFPNGNLLAAGDNDGNLSIWELSRFNKLSLVCQINLTDPILDISIASDNETLAITTNSKTIKTYKIIEGEIASLWEIDRHYLPLNSVVFTPDGKYLLSGGQDKFLYLFDTEGKFVKKITQAEEAITDIKVSSDSKLVTILTEGNGGAMSFSLPSGNKLVSFQGHKNTAYCGSFNPNSKEGSYTIASSGGNGNEILIWNAINGAILKTIDGESGIIETLKIDANGGLLIHNDVERVQYQFMFDMNEFALHSSTDIVEEGNSWENLMTPYLFKSRKIEITNDPKKDGRILSHLQLNQGSVIIGSDFTLKQYEKGKMIKEFIGHTGGVRSIVQNSQFIISGGEDEVIHFWRKSDTSRWVYPYVSLYVVDQNQWVLWTSEGYFTMAGEGSSQYGWLINNEGDFADYYSGNQFFATLYQPEKIAESFDANITVNELITSQGGRVFQLDKIQRPSISLFEQPYASDEDGKAFLLQKKGANYMSDKAKITLRAKVLDGGSGIKNLSIYQNTKLIRTEDDFSFNEHKFNKEYVVNLLPGNNQFKVVTTNLQGIESWPDIISINYSGEASANANLYVVNVGINEYLNPQYNLNYAYKDAASFIDQIKEGAENIFEEIHVFSLYNSDASKSEILNRFNTVIEEAKPQDVFIFYFAGHGTLDLDQSIGGYFLVPYNVTQLYGHISMLEEKAISSSELKMVFSKIEAQKQLIILDACHSGGAAEYFAMRGSPEEKAIVQLARSSGTVVLAASGSQQYAIEFDELGHGVFTHTLLQGLSGKADGGEIDGKITVNELKAYMEDQVPQISAQYGTSAQFPTGFSSGQDFPIGVYQQD